MPSKKSEVKNADSSPINMDFKVAKAAANKKVSSVKDLTVPVYSIAGKAAGTLKLPEDIFGAKVNKVLIAQAIRVYLTNKRTFTGSTKTRGEVHGTTAKMFRQKGTGRARHGAETAPIFVGGGVAMGPKPRNVKLDLPKKMKKAALISALSAKAGSKQIVAVADLDKVTGKTKQLSEFVGLITAEGKKDNNGKIKSTLIVTASKMTDLVKAVRNIPRVNVLSFNMINTHDIVKHQIIAVESGAISLIGKAVEVTNETEMKGKQI